MGRRKGWQFSVGNVSLRSNRVIMGVFEGRVFQAVEKHLATGILRVKKRVELSDECFKRAGYCFDNGLSGWERQHREQKAIILQRDAFNM